MCIFRKLAVGDHRWTWREVFGQRSEVDTAIETTKHMARVFVHSGKLDLGI